MVLELATLVGLLNTCQSQVDASILKRIVENESSFNPYAIGVVGVDNFNQPKTKEEAISIAKDLENKGFNYSLGLMQINHKNFDKYNLNIESAFEPCSNIKAGSQIYANCYFKAKSEFPEKTNKELLDDAASCYYSGNFSTGYKKEEKPQNSYVNRFNNKKKLNKNYINESYDSNTNNADNSQKNEWDVFGDFNQ